MASIEPGAFFGVRAPLRRQRALTTVWCPSMRWEMPMPGGWSMSMVWMPMPGQTWLGPLRRSSVCGS